MHSSRNRHPHLKAKDKPDKVNNIVKVKIGSLTKYRCVVCGNELSRRFNADRHYRRFHKIIQTRTCCDKTFYTKSDYYDHKKIVHNEYKRYGRAWIHETQPSSAKTKEEKPEKSTNTKSAHYVKDNATDKNKTKSDYYDHKKIVHNEYKRYRKAWKYEIQPSSAKTKEEKPEKSTNTKCAHYMKDNATDSKSNNKEESKTNMCHLQQSAESSTKIFIFRMQIGTHQNRVPLQSIENCKRIVKVSSNTKKNVIHDYTATSVSDLMQLMRNTISNAF